MASDSTFHRLRRYVRGLIASRQKDRVHADGGLTVGAGDTDGPLDEAGEPSRRWLEAFGDAVFHRVARSADYLGGLTLGTGWGFVDDPDRGALLSVDSLDVRRTMRVQTLIIEKLRTGNADYLFSDGFEVDAVEDRGGGVYRLTAVTDDGLVPAFEGDLLLARRFRSDRPGVGDVGAAELYESGLTVVAVDDAAAWADVTVHHGRAPEPGFEYGRIGNDGTHPERQGSILIQTSADPTIFVSDGVDSFAAWLSPSKIRTVQGDLGFLPQFAGTRTYGTAAGDLAGAHVTHTSAGTEYWLAGRQHPFAYFGPDGFRTGDDDQFMHFDPAGALAARFRGPFDVANDAGRLYFGPRVDGQPGVEAFLTLGGQDIGAGLSQAILDILGAETDISDLFGDVGALESDVDGLSTSVAGVVGDVADNVARLATIAAGVISVERTTAGVPIRVPTALATYVPRWERTEPAARLVANAVPDPERRTPPLPPGAVQAAINIDDDLERKPDGSPVLTRGGQTITRYVWDTQDGSNPLALDDEGYPVPGPPDFASLAGTLAEADGLGARYVIKIAGDGFLGEVSLSGDRSRGAEYRVRARTIVFEGDTTVRGDVRITQLLQAPQFVLQDGVATFQGGFRPVVIGGSLSASVLHAADLVAGGDTSAYLTWKAGAAAAVGVGQADSQWLGTLGDEFRTVTVTVRAEVGGPETLVRVEVDGQQVGSSMFASGLYERSFTTSAASDTYDVRVIVDTEPGQYGRGDVVGVTERAASGTAVRLHQNGLYAGENGRVRSKFVEVEAQTGLGRYFEITVPDDDNDEIYVQPKLPTGANDRPGFFIGAGGGGTTGYTGTLNLRHADGSTNVSLVVEDGLITSHAEFRDGE